MPNRRQTWPTTPARNEPVAQTLTADGLLRSDRSLVGPLRLNTAPGVGPRGPANGGNSDFGVDKISPRSFDPMGTSDNRAPNFPGSRRVQRR
jgi:hypothetical protein